VLYDTYELPLSLSKINFSLFGLSAILSRSFLSLRKLSRSPVGPRLMSVLVESTDCARTSVDWLLIEDRSDTAAKVYPLGCKPVIRPFNFQIIILKGTKFCLQS